MPRSVQLELTDDEAGALDALAAGIGQLAGRDVEADAAVVAALDFCLTRLIEDYELPDATLRTQVFAAREAMRQSWSRGNACL